jgi:hypothetical protein
MRQTKDNLVEDFLKGKSEHLRPKSIKSGRTINDLNLSKEFRAAIYTAQESYRKAPDIYRTSMEEGEDQKDGSSDSDASGNTSEDEKAHLSYRKLLNFVSQNHPVNPVTKRRFSLLDRLSVKDYGLKLLDCLCFYSIWQACGWGCKCLKRIEMRGVNKRVEKPLELKDVPDTESESDSSTDGGNDEKYAGLSSAASHLGPGAVLYFQMLKGLGILFLILSILNIPIYLLLADATAHNDYSNLNKSFGYLTLGNLGRDSDSCGSIPVTFDDQQP